MNEINLVDLAFVVDTTGSMGSLIATAQKNMIKMIDSLSKESNVKMRFGLVEYRDHPPQDATFVSKCHGFTANIGLAQSEIMTMQANGGGDTAEAVFDGLVSAAKELNWDDHSRRIAVLMGDAPPHGTKEAHDDRFATGCPCGETVESTSALLEEQKVTLYAIGLTSSVTKSFTQLAEFTGGQYFFSDIGQVMNAISDILRKEFSNIDFDKLVLQRLQEQTAMDQLIQSLSSDRYTVAASISRLGSRGLLQASA